MKYGVSLYSYQVAYENGKMDLEDCLKAMKAIPGNVNGLELLADRKKCYKQVGYIGTLSETDQGKLKGLLDKYEIQPVCYDSTITYDIGRNLFSKLDFSRNPSKTAYEDQMDVMRQELDFAASFGFPLMRAPMFYGIYKEVVRDSLKYASELGIKICCEIHAPLSADGPLVQEYLEMVDSTCPEAGGIIPDFGIYQRHMAKPGYRDALAKGADPDLLRAIDEAYDNNEDIDLIFESFNASPEDPALAKLYRRVKYKPIPDDPQKLKQLISYIENVHVKFYEMDQNLNEYCIDMEGPMKVLKDAGYDKYLCAEYEGQICTLPEELDEVTQVDRAMRYIQSF